MVKRATGVVVTSALRNLKASTCDNCLTRTLYLSKVYQLGCGKRRHRLHTNSLVVIHGKGLMRGVRPSRSFHMGIVCVTSNFIILDAPRGGCNVGKRLSLFLGPVVSLAARRRRLYLQSFRRIRCELQGASRRFRHSVLVTSARVLVLSFFSFRSRLCNRSGVSMRGTSVVDHFLGVLRGKAFHRRHRIACCTSYLYIASGCLSRISGGMDNCATGC